MEEYGKFSLKDADTILFPFVLWSTFIWQLIRQLFASLGRCEKQLQVQEHLMTPKWSVQLLAHDR